MRARRPLLPLLMLACTLVACGGGGAGGTPGGGGTGAHLTLAGSRIQAAGQDITLRGWNWGRWGLVQPGDAADNAAQGANIVRIPLRWWGQYDGKNIDSRDDSQTATAGIDAAHLATLDAAMNQASAAHLWIVLFVDSDCGQNGAQDAQEQAYCDPQQQYPQGHNFWSDPQARQKFVQVWRFLAARYRNLPGLGAFEPLPEPDPAQADDAAIAAFYDEVMSAIREVAPGVPFIVGPRLYKMTAVQTIYQPRWTDVIYTGNLFLYTGGTPQENVDNLGLRLAALTALRDGRQVPVFVQQAGVLSADDPDQAYLKALQSLLNGQGVGYTWWEYRDNTNPNGYGVIYQDGHGGWITKSAVLQALVAGFRS